MHKVAPAVEAAIEVPLLHIVDAIAAQARSRGLQALGIMGARWTMAEDFCAGRLAACGLTPVRAVDADVELTDRIVFDELTRGVVQNDSRAALVGVVRRLADAGADGVLLGCTELPLILRAADCPIPVVDSTQAHISSCVTHIVG